MAKIKAISIVIFPLFFVEYLLNLAVFHVVKQYKALNMIYLFNEAKNTAYIICNHIISNERPILYASHEAEDGFRQFLCGSSDPVEIDYKIISLGEVVRIDQSVNDVLNMPLGSSAVRETVADKLKSEG